jgi:hypothetical protein
MSNEDRSAIQLSKKILNDPAVLDRVLGNPTEEIPRLADEIIRDSPLVTDPWIYRIIVTALGLTILVVVIGAIILPIIHDPEARIPEVLTAIGSAAVGALAGLLAPPPAKQ